MSHDPFDAVPAEHREAARGATAEAVGGAAIQVIAPVAGGSSGAGLFRVDAGDLRLLLRIEGPQTPLLRRNPHRFACLLAAGAAGVSPAVRAMDEAAGVTVTDFIDELPLASFPGGAQGLAAALGELLARVQATPAFPPLVDYRDLVADMLEKVRGAGIFAPGRLDGHVERLAELRNAYDWNPSAAVSSHNDPNPGNILFDGERLWLIDWEAGYRNDPFVDVAIVSEALAPTSELQDLLLGAWLGRAAGPSDRARLATIRRFTRLYYACFLLDAGAASRTAPDEDLSAPTPGEIAAAIAELRQGSRTVAYTLGKAYLDGFLNGGDPRVVAWPGT
jgi:aminoglycoside phosphotransferase (APT) family kinase protein